MAQYVGRRPGVSSDWCVPSPCIPHSSKTCWEQLCEIFQSRGRRTLLSRTCEIALARPHWTIVLGLRVSASLSDAPRGAAFRCADLGQQLARYVLVSIGVVAAAAVLYLLIL